MSFVESLLEDELNILVVSSNSSVLTEFQQVLHQTWKEQHKKRCFRCKIHISPDIPSVLGNQGPRINFDYIIFIIDMSVCTCLQEVEENLKILGSFGRQKIALVALRGRVENISGDEIFEFARFYQLNFLFGNIDESRKLHLCNRLLNLLESCCGTVNGIPLVGNV